MTDTLVKLENVGKKFCRSFRQSLWYGVQDLGSELMGLTSGRAGLRKNEFWAVSGVSFQVRRGETLGLIGHNGAGKTTLLRLLNGLIKPDTGAIEIRGRMQALIALGAGFNPLLTGRENIYVNASVLGVSKKDTDRLFDAIVDFAGIEESIDMPVQSYSSGMAVRLGFSIAAHLEPDILLVDEVLAVGDLAFRAKCQVRIQEMKRKGVAIILVSHNLHTITHVCTRAITLEKGRVIYDGDTEQAIDLYRDSVTKGNRTTSESLRAGTGEIRVRRLEIFDEMGEVGQDFEVGDFVKIRIHYQALRPVKNPVFNLTMHLIDGHQVTGIRTDVDGYGLGTLEGEGFVEIAIPKLHLLPNIYVMDAVVFQEDGFSLCDRANNVGHLKLKGGLQINGTAYLPHTWHQSSSTEAVIAS